MFEDRSANGRTLKMVQTWYKWVVSREASFSFVKATMQKVAKMSLSQDIWLYVLSAAIGGLMSFLMTRLLKSPQYSATRRQKIPEEHDERQR